MKVLKKDKLKTDKKYLNVLFKLLDRYYVDPECALHHESPFQLLIATILSAQCTDERVNQVTPELFRSFSSAKEMRKASLADLERLVHSTGFYKNKAKNIKKCSEDLWDKYQGEVPPSLGELVQLAGVGRKTANVVLGNCFGIASGVVVDTHVTRLSNRLGLVKGKNAVVIERELNGLVPKKYWIVFSHWLILHGRQVCKARRPQCNICFLEAHCPKQIDMTK